MAVCNNATALFPAFGSHGRGYAPGPVGGVNRPLQVPAGSRAETCMNGQLLLMNTVCRLIEIHFYINKF